MVVVVVKPYHQRNYHPYSSVFHHQTMPIPQTSSTSSNSPSNDDLKSSPLHTHHHRNLHQHHRRHLYPNLRSYLSPSCQIHHQKILRHHNALKNRNRSHRFSSCWVKRLKTVEKYRLLDNTKNRSNENLVVIISIFFDWRC